MLKAAYVNLYSLLYGVCLWASIYFIHRTDTFHIHFGRDSLPFIVGLVCLAWVGTFRDLAQLSGLRFKSILALLLVCAYLLLTFDGHVAYAAIAALFWTEILDFAIFTVILKRFKSLRSIVIAVIVSDILTIPTLWFLLLSFLGAPLTALPDGTIVVQYGALAILYAVLAIIFLPHRRWEDYLSLPKAS